MDEQQKAEVAGGRAHVHSGHRAHLGHGHARWPMVHHGWPSKPFRKEVRVLGGNSVGLRRSEVK